MFIPTEFPGDSNLLTYYNKQELVLFIFYYYYFFTKEKTNKFVKRNLFIRINAV